MHWLFLILAGCFEVGFTSALARALQTTGKTSAFWFGMFGVALAFGMGFFILAARHIPMGTAYAIFAGVGAAGTMLVGVFFFQEPAGFWRLFFLTTLILSVVGLELAGG